MFLMPGDTEYISELRGLASVMSRIVIQDPVDYGTLIRESRHYDIGILDYEPVTRNHLSALPNKIFEYIHSGLAVACGPSPDIVRELAAYQCLVACDRFSVNDLAARLNGLDTETLWQLKTNAAKAAQHLCFERERPRYEHLFRKLAEV